MKHSKLLKSLLCLILVSVIGILPMTAMAAQNAYILTVNTDRSRLRDGSDANSSVITTLRKGTKVLYWGVKSNAFMKVATSSGKVGYVYRNFLSVYGAIRKNQIYVTNTPATIYKKSGSKLKSFAKVSSGKYLMVVAQNSVWAYVRTMTGKSGYIKSSALSKAF